MYKLLLYTPALSTGRDTPQYNAVLSLAETITARLKTTKAVQSLSWKYKEKKWIDPNTDFNEDNLVSCALENIRQDATQFLTFVEMLSNTTGMDDIVDKLKEKEKE